MTKKLFELVLTFRNRITELENLGAERTPEYAHLCDALDAFAELFAKKTKENGTIDSKTYRCIESHYFHGLSYPQISQAMYPGDTPSALNKRVLRYFAREEELT